MKEKSLIIGASYGLGKSLAFELASKGHILFLCARSINKLKIIKQTLEEKFNNDIYILEVDISNFNENLLAKNIKIHLPCITNIFFIAGKSGIDFSGYVDEKVFNEIIQINYLSHIRVMNVFLKNKIIPKNICVASSVACIRPRARNGLYTSSKMGLESYFRSLQFFLNKKCKIQIYRLGFMKTRMNKEESSFLPKVETKVIAEKIVKNLNNKQGVLYLPIWWKVISFFLNLLPLFIFKNLKI